MRRKELTTKPHDGNREWTVRRALGVTSTGARIHRQAKRACQRVKKCPLTMRHMANAAVAKAEEQERRSLLRSLFLCLSLFPSLFLFLSFSLSFSLSLFLSLSLKAQGGHCSCVIRHGFVFCFREYSQFSTRDRMYITWTLYINVVPPRVCCLFPFVHRQTQLSCTIHSLTSVCAHLTWIKQAFRLQSCFQRNKCHHDITHGSGHVS